MLGPQAEHLASVLAWQRGAEVITWQLWSCVLVHFSVWHALGDAVVLLVGGFWAERQLGPKRLALAWVCVAPLAVLCVAWLQPDVNQLRGASALSVFNLGVAWRVFWAEALIPRPWLAVFGLGWLAKTVADAWGMHAALSLVPAGVGVAWPAHVWAAGCAMMIYQGTARCKSLANAIDSH